MKYSIPIDYPKIPEELLSTATTDNIRIHPGQTDVMYERLGRHYSDVHYTIAEPDNLLLLDWLVDNIKSPVYHPSWANSVRRRVRVRTQTSINGQPNGFRPHIDYGCVASLMYFWDTGGENVETSWWNHSDFGLVDFTKIYRAGPSYEDGGYTINYNDLTLLESIVAETGQWYLYCGAVIHDVCGVTNTRKYYSISIKTFDELRLLGFTDFGFK